MKFRKYALLTSGRIIFNLRNYVGLLTLQMLGNGFYEK